MMTLSGKGALRVARVAAMILGAVLFVYVVRDVGAEALVDSLSGMGWWLLGVFALSLSWKALNTLSWRVAMPSDVRSPRFLRLLEANMAADFLNQTLPSANLGGEVAKPYFLRHDVPIGASLAGVLANKTVEMVAGMVVAAIGVGMAVAWLPLAMPVRMALTAVALLGLAGVAVGTAAQRRAPASRAVGMVEKMGIVTVRAAEVSASVDRALRMFYDLRRSPFWICAGLRLSSLALGVAETWFIIRVLGVQVSASSAFMLFALALLIDVAFFFVPGGLGTMEAGSVYLFVLLGLSPAVGLALALVKRARKLFWMGAGMAVLYRPRSPAGLPGRSPDQHTFTPEEAIP